MHTVSVLSVATMMDGTGTIAFVDAAGHTVARAGDRHTVIGLAFRGWAAWANQDGEMLAVRSGIHPEQLPIPPTGWQRWNGS